jgi:hypothetical protein
MGRSALAALALLVAACGGHADPGSPKGGIRDVVVVLTHGDEPLPFDPRGGRITAVTDSITRLVGHPVVLELDTALSPELKASLEETVLASFETYARELVLLQKEDPAMFAEAKRIARVVCTYDAVATDSKGALEARGTRLAVRAPPDRFPLLERWVVSEAVYLAHIDALEARWGEADPTKLPEREQSAWLGYMTTTRPGAGYLWIANRRKKQGGEKGDDLRVEHVGRILALARVIPKRSPLDARTTAFLLENAGFLGGFSARPPGPFHADPALVSRVTGGYAAWLGDRAPGFDDADRLKLAHAVFEHRNSFCGGTDRGRCTPDAVFPGFDRLAFGLSIYDAWVKDNAPFDVSGPAPRAVLFKEVLCPQKPRGEAETEIRWGCSPFFGVAIEDDADRARLAERIASRHDARLLEQALLNHPHGGGPAALALVESLRDDALQRRGLSVLFHDLARVDDVRSALENEAPRWWRDQPGRRGFALLVMARQNEHLDTHYGDSHWQRFVAEFGGPIGKDVLAAFLAEGARAAEMAPKIWPALAKGPERDALVARAMTTLLEKDRADRTTRARGPLLLLRFRYCTEKNEAGFATVRGALDGWAKAHPDDAAAVANARADFTVARCAKATADPD